MLPPQSADPLLDDEPDEPWEADAYPFVLSPPVIEKLGFIQAVVRQAGASQWTVPGPDGPLPINRPEV